MQVRQNLKLSPCSAPSASCRALGRRTAQLFLQSAQFAFLLGRPGRGSELWGHQSQLQPPALPASPPPPKLPPSTLAIPSSRSQFTAIHATLGQYSPWSMGG